MTDKVLPLGIPEDIEQLIYSFIPPPKVRKFELNKVYKLIEDSDSWLDCCDCDENRLYAYTKDGCQPIYFGHDIIITKLTPKRIYYTLRGLYGGELKRYSQHRMQDYTSINLESQGYDKHNYKSVHIYAKDCRERYADHGKPNITWAEKWV